MNAQECLRSFADYAIERGSSVTIERSGQPLAEAVKACDVILSCGGRADERREAGEPSVRYCKPMIEAAVENLRGHVQVCVQLLLFSLSTY